MIQAFDEEVLDMEVLGKERIERRGLELLGKERIERRGKNKRDKK